MGGGSYSDCTAQALALLILATFTSLCDALQ